MLPLKIVNCLSIYILWSYKVYLCKPSPGGEIGSRAIDWTNDFLDPILIRKPCTIYSTMHLQSRSWTSFSSNYLLLLFKREEGRGRGGGRRKGKKLSKILDSYFCYIWFVLHCSNSWISFYSYYWQITKTIHLNPWFQPPSHSYGMRNCHLN